MPPLRLTDEDIQACFDLYDTDGSGELDAEEVEFAMKSLGWGQVTKRDVDEFMKNVDTSEDDKVDLAEFTRMIKSKMIEAGGAAEIAHMFSVFDFDKNGKVGVQDLARIAELVGEKVSLDYIQELINWADYDRDGQLNYDEFHNAVSKYEGVLDPRSQRSRE